MKRTIAIVVAVTLALLGALSVTAYAKTADARALAGQEAQVVWTTTDVVPAGTTAAEALGAGLIEETLLASRAVPAGALTAVDPESTDVAVSDIAPGEVLLAARFGDEPTGTEALVVPEGLVAVTVQLSDPGRVSVFLRPGSNVVVYNTFTARNADSGDYTPVGLGLGAGEEGAVNATRVLLPEAKVLAVGAVTFAGAAPAPGTEGDVVQEPQAQVPQALVTLAVSPDDAQRLVHAAQTGTLYAALRGEGATVPDSVVDDRRLFTP